MLNVDACPNGGGCLRTLTTRGRSDRRRRRPRRKPGGIKVSPLVRRDKPRLIPARNPVVILRRLHTQRRYVGLPVEIPSSVEAVRESARLTAARQDAEQPS